MQPDIRFIVAFPAIWVYPSVYRKPGQLEPGSVVKRVVKAYPGISSIEGTHNRLWRSTLSLTVARHAKGHENPASLRKSPPIHHSNDRTWLQNHHVLCCSGDAHQRAQSSRQGEEERERMGFRYCRIRSDPLAVTSPLLRSLEWSRRNQIASGVLRVCARVRPSPVLDIYYVFNFAGASRTYSFVPSKLSIREWFTKQGKLLHESRIRDELQIAGELPKIHTCLE